VKTKVSFNASNTAEASNFQNGKYLHRWKTPCLKSSFKKSCEQLILLKLEYLKILYTHIYV